MTMRSFTIALLLLTTACSSGTDAQPLASETPPGRTGAAFSSDHFPSIVSLSELHQTELLDFRLDSVLSAGDFGGPWGIAFLPGGTTLITERDGNLRIVRKGVIDPEPVAGVPEVYANGQGGLLDVEPHPQIAENGWIYLSYSIPGPGGGHTAVMRARLKDEGPGAASLVDNDVLFTGGPFTRARVHFGSRLDFDPEGYLYFTIGDRGEMDNAQDLNHYSGKVYRLHDDGRIPEDNPFVGRTDAKGEIFTYGNRNPQGMAVHPVTGRIWTHEHGPRGGDEINLMESGVNYGWPVISYGINYDGSIITHDQELAGMAQPIHYWDPSIAPSGMEFVNAERGPVRYPSWVNQMIVGALKFQMMVRVELDGEEYVKEERFLEGLGRVREVEQGPDGYLYLLTESPVGLFRIMPEE